MKITWLINLIGLVLGIVWFGWWFLVPAMLTWFSLKINGQEV